MTVFRRNKDAQEVPAAEPPKRESPKVTNPTGSSTVAPTRSTGTPAAGAASWMFRGEQAEKALKDYERECALNAKKFKPEIFMSDGTNIQMVFLDEFELFGVFRYYYERNYYTKPANPAEDMFQVYGVDVNAAYHKVYEVVNISGYTDKEGVDHPEPQVKYFIATSSAIRQRLDQLAVKWGEVKDNEGKGTLKGVMIDLAVQGSGKGRLVTLDFAGMYQGDPLKHNGANLQRNGLKKAQELYAPLTVAEQKLILGV